MTKMPCFNEPERERLRPTETITEIAKIVFDWRNGNETAASALTEISLILKEGVRKK